jgi:hypothetical protein
MRTQDPRGPSHRLTFDEAVEVWLAVWRGEFKNRIAAHYDCNIWRIYDVLQGRLHAGSKQVAEKKERDGDSGGPSPLSPQPSLPF